jgi:FkbM family methyltransferase
MRKYRRILNKMLFDRRPFSGRREFRIRPWLRKREFVMDVSGRDDQFRHRMFLRRKTSDMRTFEQVFLDGDYNMRSLPRSDDIVRFYNEIVDVGKTPVILDLGANIGLASIYFAKNWPSAKIIAVEPNLENYEQMLRNFGNDVRMIQPVHAAVASEDGFVKIANPGAEKFAFRTETVTEKTGIPAYSIKNLLQRIPNTVPFVAKIDIEGFEKNLFAKNTEWVASFPVIVIELHDWLLPKQGTSSTFLRAISGLDRDFLAHGENIYSIASSGP